MPSGQEDIEGVPDTASVDDHGEYDVIIVGAGAAGIGVGIAIVHAGIESLLIVDRETVGHSFSSWPDETRFITPSFPSNSVGMLDLNSIAIGISPAFSMRVEHPTGKEYAEHLRDISEFFELPIREKTDVMNIEKIEGLFHLETKEETLLAKNVIWAAGEYQYPLLDGFAGSELCRHTSTVPSYNKLEGDDFLIIGGYESGIDAAAHLSNMSKKELLILMTAGMATISGSIMIALAGQLENQFAGINVVQHFLTASILSVPAAIMYAEIMYPSEEITPSIDNEEEERIYKGSMDAVTRGTKDGLNIAVNVAAILIAVLALYCCFMVFKVSANAGFFLLPLLFVLPPSVFKGGKKESGEKE